MAIWPNSGWFSTSTPVEKLSNGVISHSHTVSDFLMRDFLFTKENDFVLLNLGHMGVISFESPDGFNGFNLNRINGVYLVSRGNCNPRTWPPGFRFWEDYIRREEIKSIRGSSPEIVKITSLVSAPNSDLSTLLEPIKGEIYAIQTSFLDGVIAHLTLDLTYGFSVINEKVVCSNISDRSRNRVS